MSDVLQATGSNLSEVWLKAVSLVLDTPNKPLCVSISLPNNKILEDTAIRSELDSLLATKEKISVRETSETIFPINYWRTHQPSLSDLSAWYLHRYLPRHRARIRKVRQGTPRDTYFERLIAYPGFQQTKQGIKSSQINQLGHIIDTYKHYRSLGRQPSPSKYIATCLNPSIDNNNFAPYVPFPCLQQIGFAFSDESITVTGFYTIQYLMKRGYGNYLGLCYLGEFMSKETGLPLSRVNCFIGTPRVDNFSKNTLRSIFRRLP